MKANFENAVTKESTLPKIGDVLAYSEKLKNLVLLRGNRKEKYELQIGKYCISNLPQPDTRENFLFFLDFILIVSASTGLSFDFVRDNPDYSLAIVFTEQE